MLDLAPGELAINRNRDIVRVRGRSNGKLIVVPLALNGFGNTLWEETPYGVSDETGHYSATPHKLDLVDKVRLRTTFLSYKVIREPLRQWS